MRAKFYKKTKTRARESRRLVTLYLHTISPLDKTTSCPRSSIFSRYCFDSPARNIRIFLRSSSFDLPFRKDVFSFQRREISVLNIQASSARRHFLFIVVRVKAVLFLSTRWKDNCRDYFNSPRGFASYVFLVCNPVQYVS